MSWSPTEDRILEDHEAKLISVAMWEAVDKAKTWVARRDALLVLWLLHSGMRISEVLLLRNQDSLSTHIVVHRLKRNPHRGWRCRCGTWNRYGQQLCSGGIVNGETKTVIPCKNQAPMKRARKTDDRFPVRDAQNKILQGIREAKTRYGVANKEIDFVFCKSNGSRISRFYAWRYWAQILKELNLKHRPLHSARHSFVTRSVKTTRDLSIVKELVGHSSITVTEKYRHIAMNEMEKALDDIGNI